jgi:hypothetical protein
LDRMKTDAIVGRVADLLPHSCSRSIVLTCSLLM